jgi:hypothetical protein
MAWCPPLFDENPRAGTKRLFLYASDRIAAMLRKKYKIRGYVADDYEYMAHMAWLIGGTSAGQALIREVGWVKSTWNKGDDQKTLSITKVCTAHMMSVWFRSMERRPQLAPDDGEGCQYRAASSMLGVINQLLCADDAKVCARTAQDVKDFMNMDLQWNRENDSRGQPSTYSLLLLSQALEACGQCCIEWDRVAFPVESVHQLLDSDAILAPRLLEDGQVLLAVLTCADEGVRAMKRYYEMNIKGRLQPPGKR